MGANSFGSCAAVSSHAAKLIRRSEQRNRTGERHAVEMISTVKNKTGRRVRPPRSARKK